MHKMAACLELCMWENITDTWNRFLATSKGWVPSFAIIPAANPQKNLSHRC